MTKERRIRIFEPVLIKEGAKEESRIDEEEVQSIEVDTLHCICGQPAGPNMLKCKDCKKCYHRDCIKISEVISTSNKQKSWICPKCTFKSTNYSNLKKNNIVSSKDVPK